MTVDIFPAGINSQGNNTWIVTPTNPVMPDGAGVSLAILKGATAVDLTCYLPNSEQEIGFDQAREDDTRACDTNTREEFGAATFSRESVFHIVHPQGDPTDPGNLAVGALPANDVVYATLVMGIPHEGGQALAVANKSDVYAITTGADHTTPRESGKYRREVKTSFTRIGHNLPIVAGA